jgi:hypothetical protein
LFWFTIVAQHETDDVILYIHSVHKHRGNSFKLQNYKMRLKQIRLNWINSMQVKKILFTNVFFSWSSMGYTSGAGTAYCSGPHEFTPGFKWGSCYSIFSFMFCRSLDVLFFWPLCCLFFFDIRILITPVVSSKSSYQVLDKNDFKIIIPYIFCLLYKSNKTI